MKNLMSHEIGRIGKVLAKQYNLRPDMLVTDFRRWKDLQEKVDSGVFSDADEHEKFQIVRKYIERKDLTSQIACNKRFTVRTTYFDYEKYIDIYDGEICNELLARVGFDNGYMYVVCTYTDEIERHEFIGIAQNHITDCAL